MMTEPEWVSLPRKNIGAIAHTVWTNVHAASLTSSGVSLDELFQEKINFSGI